MRSRPGHLPPNHGGARVSGSVARRPSELRERCSSAKSSTAKLDSVRAGLSLLPEEIPQCVNYFYGGDLGLTKVHTDEDFDFAIIADFDNYKDYQIYATHPAHQEFTKRILRPLIKNRAAVQFLL